MQPETLNATPATGSPAKIRYAGPIWTLVLLAPLIAEVLSGSTRMSFIFVYVPETMVWGCGALLCRELVRRWRGGATSLLLLGLALSIAEEFVIQQTSLAPLPFPGAHAQYGRLWGVNWVYFLFMLGYESVWVAVVPVTLTELIFPSRRSQPWLRRGGLITACSVFAVGCYIAWFTWTQRALPRKMHVPPYHPPLVAIASGIAAILLLGIVAYALRAVGRETAMNSLRPPHTPGATRTIAQAIAFTAGIAAFALGCAWFKLIAMVFTPVHSPAWVPMIAGFAGALSTYALFRALSSSAWGDAQRWAASFGATMACMSVGYLSTAGWTRFDLIGKAILNVLALVGPLWLGVKVRRHAAAAEES
ncbi:MAG TPA: hypothetical protein VHX20_13825 [Terracidiphilus sp.]|jgi:hypothetical protein|nr:hypothetical protein [Terracidiphilus sp.]